MANPSWKTAEAKLSVLVNGLFLPFKSAPDGMQRYVRPALFSTADAVFQVQFGGTALMAKYRDLYVGIVTEHQTTDKNYTEQDGSFVVVVETDGRRVGVPPTSAHRPRFEHNDHRSLEDLIVFDYTTVRPELRAHHLDLSDIVWSDTTGLHADYSFAVGFPTHSVDIELDPDDYTKVNDFRFKWIRQDLEQVSPEPMDTENRLIFVKRTGSTRLSIDPDGLSGSPVFSIVHNGDNFRRLRFDGIVTNAKGDRFAVYPSVHLRDVLDDIVARGTHRPSKAK